MKTDSETASTPYLVTPAQACQALGVHRHTLAAWRRRGWLRAVKTPTGQHRYPLSEIERIVGSATNGTEAARGAID